MSLKQQRPLDNPLSAVKRDFTAIVTSEICIGIRTTKHTIMYNVNFAQGKISNITCVYCYNVTFIKADQDAE